MKVGIELRYITTGTSGGIAPLVRHLLGPLFELSPDDEFVVFCTIFNRSLLRDDLPNVRFVVLPCLGFFEEAARLASEEKIDVFFRGYPVEDSFRFPVGRQVVVVPDMQHEFLPDFFEKEVLRSRRTAFNRFLSGAGAVVTISEHARRTIVEHPWTRCPRIVVAPPALAPDFASAAGTAPQSPDEGARGGYFLFPANCWPHKNHRGLLEAFRRFRARTSGDVRLVLTGHPEGWPDLRRSFPDLPVEHLGFVPPESLTALMKGARALTFFSLFEGFGMPLLEAFALGTPVICSDRTSLPEVGGDAVLSCDPTDPEAMSVLMERVTAEPALRRQMVEKGRLRLGLFSWQRSAETVRAALQDVARDVNRVPTHPPGISHLDEAPLVSIVTPSFNQGRFLKRTIDSVLGQTYPRIEYIVRDGGSNDGSIDILKSYGSRFRWVAEKDAGQSDALRKGFGEASGDVLAYLNSDDVLLPDAVARAVEHFRRRPLCDVVYGRARYIDEDDGPLGDYRTAEYSFARLMEDCCICQPAAFWRKRIADVAGPFRVDLHFVMDFEYWLRIDRAGGTIESIPDFLACSRLYPGTKTLSGRAEIYREIFQVSREHGGYVHLNYYYGLWNHRIEEGRPGLFRLFPASPRLSHLLARTHARWDHRSRLPNRIATEWRRTRAARKDLRWVNGLSHDNWVGPILTVRIPAGQGRRSGSIRGLSPVDATARITAGSGALHPVTIPAGRPTTLEVPLQGGAGDTVTIRFSSSVADAAGRHRSFFLEGTDLFSEHDVISAGPVSSVAKAYARLVR